MKFQFNWLRPHQWFRYQWWGLSITIYGKRMIHLRIPNFYTDVCASCAERKAHIKRLERQLYYWGSE